MNNLGNVTNFPQVRSIAHDIVDLVLLYMLTLHSVTKRIKRGQGNW